MPADTILQLLLTGAAVVALSLGVWILNSVSKEIVELKEDIKELHGRIGGIVEDRMKKWLEKEKECGEEHMRISLLEERIKK